MLEFTDRIERIIHGRAVTAERVGSVYLCDAERVCGDELRRFIESGAVEHVGAMGTRAKEFAGRERIYPDYTYGVIDRCILKALIGEDSLIITSGGMVEHVKRRIGEYSAESGQKIPVIPVEEHKGRHGARVTS